MYDAGDTSLEDLYLVNVPKITHLQLKKKLSFSREHERDLYNCVPFSCKIFILSVSD